MLWLINVFTYGENYFSVHSPCCHWVSSCSLKLEVRAHCSFLWWFWYNYTSLFLLHNCYYDHAVVWCYCFGLRLEVVYSNRKFLRGIFFLIFYWGCSVLIGWEQWCICSYTLFAAPAAVLSVRSFPISNYHYHQGGETKTDSIRSNGKHKKK